MKTKKKKRMSIYTKALICLALFLLFFAVFAIPMGLGNALNTMMNTAYRLLVDTVFYIMAIAVMAGAMSGLLTEFGVVKLLNKVLSPLMKPLFGMPGASALGMVSTYLSDNPAILTLADDRKFRRFFKAYQIPALTNLGTAFGMGLIVTSFALGMSSTLGDKVWLAAICGNLGAIIGAIVSTRLMLIFMKRSYGPDEPALKEDIEDDDDGHAVHHKGFLHVLDALMDGGKKGVELGLGVIPGVLIICTIVLMLTNSAPVPQYKYVIVENVSANGTIMRETLSIEIPDQGNLLSDVRPNLGVSKWLDSASGTAEAVTSYDTYTSDGRMFSAGESLQVELSMGSWSENDHYDPADGTYRLVLIREGETAEKGTVVDLAPVGEISETGTQLFTARIPAEDYKGEAFEGIAVIPWLANQIDFLLKPLFGFSSGEAIAVPVTALGSAGAALGLIPGFAKEGLINVGDLAVFVAICMCWSGYLSTHVSMMEVLGCREHTGKAILCHTVGGLIAGVSAHWVFVLLARLI